MISLAIRRKKQLFKENNASLYRLLLIIIFFLAPVLLIFAPLPGYLLGEGEHLSGKLLATSFFIFLAFIESFVYWNLWSRKELLYLDYIHGKYNMLSKHIMSFVPSCIFYFIFVFSAFFRVSISLSSIAYVLTCS